MRKGSSIPTDRGEALAQVDSKGRGDGNPSVLYGQSSLHRPGKDRVWCLLLRGLQSHSQAEVSAVEYRHQKGAVAVTEPTRDLTGELNTGADMF